MQKKKKQVAVGGWARDAREKGRGSWRRPSPGRWVSCQAWQLVGTEGFRWTPPGLGTDTHTHLHCVRLHAAKQELARSPSSWSTQLLSKPKRILHSGTLWFFSLVYFVATLRGMWNLSSPAEDRTCAPCIGKLES